MLKHQKQSLENREGQKKTAFIASIPHYPGCSSQYKNTIKKIKHIRLKRRKQLYQLFIHKSVFSTYYVLDTVLDTDEISSGGKKTKFLPLWNLHSSHRWGKVKQ